MIQKFYSWVYIWKKKPKNSGLKRHMHNVHRSITYSFQGVQSNLTVDPQTNG